MLVIYEFENRLSYNLPECCLPSVGDVWSCRKIAETVQSLHVESRVCARVGGVIVGGVPFVWGWARVV